MYAAIRDINIVLVDAAILLAICVVIAIFYIFFLSVVHLRARQCLLFHRSIQKQVDKMRQARSQGVDFAGFDRWENLEASIRRLLEREGVLKPTRPPD